ncbi:hypothetical protein O7635_27660 [Asanoa sp. WMMD1127]|uniref:hypothetical protein n=1 Tax=Asanoa sp. WMMD1127 TaxID=3016107 RepID=UPI0024180F99|nr:hypothetical protein [Asanoa sp. WMMD1127]MDG4825641.1 hypothetical protein [Asanoa sp. WMMD1127]
MRGAVVGAILWPVFVIVFFTALWYGLHAYFRRRRARKEREFHEKPPHKRPRRHF